MMGIGIFLCGFGLGIAAWVFVMDVIPAYLAMAESQRTRVIWHKAVENWRATRASVDEMERQRGW